MARGNRKSADSRGMTIITLKRLRCLGSFIQFGLQISRMIMTRHAGHDRDVGILQRLQIAVSRNSNMTRHAIARVHKIAFVVYRGVIELQRVPFDDRRF